MNAETQIRPIFGQITLQDMQNNELLTRTVMPLIKEVCGHSRGRFTVDDVADGLIKGEFLLWGVMRPPAKLESVAITKAVHQVFEVLMLGPDVNDMFTCLPILDRAAKASGCARMRMSGPAYWKKQLPEGWRPASMIFEKDLAHPA